MALSSADAAAAVAFEPTEAGLDAVLDIVAPSHAGGAQAERARRKRALARYRTLAMPGARPSRGWRHDYDAIDVRGLRWATGEMTIPTSPFDALAALTAEPEADVPALATDNAGGLVHNGALAIRHDTPQSLPHGVTVVPIGRDGAPLDVPGADTLDALADAGAHDRFAALAEAFYNCGAYVHVADGVVLEKPIQLVFATPEGNRDAVFPRIVVVLGTGARATVIERHVGSADAFVCGTVVANVADGATLEYVAVQQTGENARVFMHRHATCARGATARFDLAELGGTLVRSVLELDLGAEGAHADASALFFNTGFQHVDLSTTTTHVVGNTTSDTVVRSAATDRGQGRFFGNIAIRKAAHGADASLRDDALLLSKRAHIDSVPALEIAANDVRAFHGATVGSLDEDALFYAGSRGIARPDAVRMVALAFFEPVISRFPGEALRDEVRTALDHKIDAATDIGA